MKLIILFWNRKKLLSSKVMTDKIIRKIKVRIISEFETSVDIYSDTKEPYEYAIQVAKERFKDNDEQIKIVGIDTDSLIDSEID
jgi:hypothetical protein